MRTYNKATKKEVRDQLKERYPLYEDFYEYIIAVLFVMGYQPGDPFSVEIIDLGEPSKITISIEPKYTH